jgi:hypothetical protein
MRPNEAGILGKLDVFLIVDGLCHIAEAAPGDDFNSEADHRSLVDRTGIVLEERGLDRRISWDAGSRAFQILCSG